MVPKPARKPLTFAARVSGVGPRPGMDGGFNAAILLSNEDSGLLVS